MADNRQSGEFDALSERAKETANKIRTAGERESNQLKADVIAARGRATATAEHVKETANDVSAEASSHWDEIRAKWKAHVAKARSNIEAKVDEKDVKASERYADLAEDYAWYAISFMQDAIGGRGRGPGRGVRPGERDRARLRICGAMTVAEDARLLMAGSGR